MAKHLVIVFIAALIFTACDDSAQRAVPKGRKPIIAEKPFPTEKEAPIDIPPPPAPYTGPQKYCYEMELGNNTREVTSMHFILDDNDSIHGRLDYAYADKPATHGTIEGLKEGSFVELMYTYADSGIQKQEIITIKIENDKIFKKNGPLVQENGVWVLENPLRATLQLFLIKTDCK